MMQSGTLFLFLFVLNLTKTSEHLYSAYDVFCFAIKMRAFVPFVSNKSSWSFPEAPIYRFVFDNPKMAFQINDCLSFESQEILSVPLLRTGKFSKLESEHNSKFETNMIFQFYIFF